MKKMIPAAMLAAAALTLAGCGAAPEESTSGSGEAGAEGGGNSDFSACIVSDEGGWDDASFNEAAYNGLMKAKEKLGITVREAESNDPGQYASNVDAMVQAGCSLILGVGFNLENAIQAAAEENKDTNFGLIDSAFTDEDFNVVTYDNAKPLLFNTQEAAYLGGYLAAGMTETGTVATYGGQALPSVTIFMDGFVDGVAAYNKAHDADVEALGWDKDAQDGSFTGDFTNTEAGYTTTQQFIASGADIIMPVAGPVGAGTLRAASEADDVSVIWVDQDGYEQPANSEFKDLILTSVVKGIANSVFDTVKAASEGNFSSEPYIGTLENGGVGLAPYHSFEDDVPADLQSEIEDLKQQIIDGELKVTSPSAN